MLITLIKIYKYTRKINIFLVLLRYYLVMAGYFEIIMNESSCIKMIVPINKNFGIGVERDIL